MKLYEQLSLVLFVDMEQQFDFTVSDLASKCRSKTELYNVSTREGKLYLSPMKNCTQKFIRNLMRGEKEYVRCSAVNIINAPHYKGLKVRDIVDFARTKVNITSYLPDYDYVKDPNHEWVCSIVNSLIPKEFQEFIQQKEDKRIKELPMPSNLAMRIKPEFLDIFKSSQAVSIVKGKSHYLTRYQKRTKDQITISICNEKKKEVERRAEESQKEIRYLKNKLSKLEDIERENDENIEKVGKLYDAGIINEEGNYINNEME